MTHPTISVIIPAYNIGEQLTRAIDSVLAQSRPVQEIFVVDDGSQDNTADVAERYGPPVQVIRKENGGPASARNLGASRATGEWLALLDSDDWWFPQKTEIQLTAAIAADVGLTHCLFDHRIERPPPELTFNDLWEQNWIGNSSVMIRRSLFQQLGGFNEARALISVEDYNLWLRVAAAGWRIVTCPHILVHYTQGTGISSNLERLMRASLFNLDDLEERLELPAEKVRQKRLQLRAGFGRQALYDRKLSIARELLGQTLRDQPNAANALSLLAANLPASALNVKRNLTSRVTGSAARHGMESGSSGDCDNALVPMEEAPFWGGRRSASILDPAFHTPAATETLLKPMLVTTIDAEEDFDWSAPFFRSSSKVTSMRSQHRAHRVYERFGVVPVYMVDYPVASQDEGRAPLLELLKGGHCEIGAQLHPWVTPPFIEDISVRNSYPGNLPQAVEHAKLAALTESLEQVFGTRPRLYRAGRCGVGPNTGEILKHLGYLADTSVMPHWNYRPQRGPDFRALSAKPYWFDADRTILEMPISSALVGHASRLSLPISIDLFGKLSQRFGVTSMIARLGVIERIRLTPEGIRIEEAKRLVRHMAAAGHRIFVLTYHSPSLEPGNTPYVRSQEDLVRFLAWLDEFFDFFTKEIGGTCASWRDVRASLLAAETAGRLEQPAAAAHNGSQ